MRRFAFVVAAAAGIAACGSAVGVSSSTTRLPARRVLVLTQTLGYHHASIPWAVRALRRVGSADGRYQLVLLSDATQLTPAALQRAAAVVFLLTTGDLPLTSTEKAALIAFVHRGGGLVGFHSATDTFHHWSGYLSLIGAEFRMHPLPSSQRVIVEDRHSSVTRGLPGSFRIFEEFYVFKHDPRPRVHVLARLDTGPRGPDRPLVWCRHAGRGRVFYDELGHFIQTWSDPRQLKLVSGGISWAAGVGHASDC
jgi:type 1 glutamine amidotransferase